jgi:hypothetical protein
MTNVKIFHTEFAVYAMWMFILAIVLFFPVFTLFIEGWSMFVKQGGLGGLTLLSCLFAPCFIWLSRYRLIFGDHDLRYRSWKLHEDVINYDDILSVEVSKATPLANAPVSTHINTKDGRVIIVYTKAFPAEAVEMLFSLGEHHLDNEWLRKRKAKRHAASRA